MDNNQKNKEADLLQLKSSNLDEVIVKIRNISFGGEGVGEVIGARDEAMLGISCFVPYTARGEAVRARIQENKGTYLKANLVEILEEPASPTRVEPLCSYFQKCGGCELQHIDYQAQLEAKFDLLVGSLASSKFSQEVISNVNKIIPSTPYHYRKRITLHLNQNGQYGFYKTNSRVLVSINKCEIADKKINDILLVLRSFTEKIKGIDASILIEADESKTVIVIKIPERLQSNKISEIKDAIDKDLAHALLFVSGKLIYSKGDNYLQHEVIKGISLKVPAGSFAQVNLNVNQKLVEHVLKHIKGPKVFDYYAGAGNFTVPIASRGYKVTSVEMDQELVQFGRINLAARNIRGVPYHQSSVEKFNKSNKETPDTIVLDPPRSGLQNSYLDMPRAQRVILVSCHMGSFLRDLKNLSKIGYKPMSITAFDMFAQTSYLEIATILDLT